MKCPKCQYNNPDDTLFCGKCGTRFPSPEEAEVTETMESPKEELTTGSTFADRYQIIEELGKGGMGRVYKAHDTRIKEKIALKLIKPEIARNKKAIERFSNELKLARKIRHKNICQMFDLGEEKGTHFITMEFIPGEDLKSMIRMSGRLAAGTTISIGKQVCEGLAEAHKSGVVHRDLKPSNIMIDKEGNVRIMDFGIARSLESKGITGAGVMIGTPEYMSPEQVEGKEVDQRSDIYSLGVILYEMVTGQVPFEGDTPFTIGVKHKSEIPKNPKELNAQIPDDLSHLILKCLEKDKENRFQSAVEVRSELIRIEESIPTAEMAFPRRRAITSREISERINKMKWKKYILYGAVAILVVFIIVAGLSLFTRRQAAIDSIAVLPLQNLSGNPEQEYFADGMTEALISELAKISAFRRVISRTSVMQYKEARKSMTEIAHELNVDAMVEGSVLLVGQRVRITAQLIEARKDRHLWSNDYERDLSDILKLQKEVANAIAREINIALTPKEQAFLEQAHAVNPEAYQLYLKGRFFWNKRTTEGLNRANDYFEQSINKDPNCAQAYAGLADSYNILGEYGYLPPKEAFPRAKAAALKALEIDDTLTEAHASLAWIKFDYDWDWEGAEREFKRAIELNPAYATAHHWYALYLARMARFEEAIKEITRSLELDPLSLVINRSTGLIFYHARQYDRSIEALRKTIEMDPNFSSAHWWLGLVYLQKSMYKEALAEFQREKNLSKVFSPFALQSIGLAYAKMGKSEEAQQVLNELTERRKEAYVQPSHIATLYFVLGKENQGFEWLEKAYEGRDSGLTYLKTDPVFDSVRSDPRFKALLEKMGLDK